MDVLVLEREVWNFISHMVFDKKITPSLKTIHNECYYACKEKFPTAPSQMIIRSEKSVLATFSQSILINTKLQNLRFVRN
jgi:hypothetical protein